MARLSEIDRRILRLVAQGYTSKEIAREMDRSPLTIDGRLKDVCQRLGADTRAQAAAMLMREEALDAPPELGGGGTRGIVSAGNRSPIVREDGGPRDGQGWSEGQAGHPLFDPRLTRIATRMLLILVAVAAAAYFLANAIEAIQGVYLTLLRG